MTTAQDILKEIEREEKERREHRQKEPDGINIEIIRNMTPKQIKKHIEFFQMREEQKKADENITLLFNLKIKHKKIKKDMEEYIKKWK